MKYLKLFEDFKKNNEEGNLITEDDIIKCIKGEGVIYAETIKGLKDTETKDIKHKKEDPLKPVSVDEETVTVNLNGDTFEVDLENIISIEY